MFGKRKYKEVPEKYRKVFDAIYELSKDSKVEEAYCAVFDENGKLKRIVNITGASSARYVEINLEKIQKCFSRNEYVGIIHTHVEDRPPSNVDDGVYRWLKRKLKKKLLFFGVISLPSQKYFVMRA